MTEKPKREVKVGQIYDMGAKADPDELYIIIGIQQTIVEDVVIVYSISGVSFHTWDMRFPTVDRLIVDV